MATTNLPPGSKYEQYLNLAVGGDLWNARAIAEFAADQSLSDWGTWEIAWVDLIDLNVSIAQQAYAQARLKPTPVPPATSGGTWNNGITRQTNIPGSPPPDWILRDDGFWYPPAPLHSGSVVIDLTNVIQIGPPIGNQLLRTYILGTLTTPDPIQYTFFNRAENMTVNVLLTSITGINFDTPAFSLLPRTKVTITVSFDAIPLDKLQEGINSTDIFINLTAGNISVQSNGDNSIIIGPPDPTLPGATVIVQPSFPTGPTWKNGITRLVTPGFPPIDWLLGVDGYWYPILSTVPPPVQSTWKNGVTHTIDTGQPPVGWVLGSDGYWYPPTISGPAINPPAINVPAPVTGSSPPPIVSPGGGTVIFPKPL